MHDLPAQTLLQQLHAHPISGEELEVMGKKAASRYLCGDCCTLNDAVVETVKQAGLSPEQVKRVIEFANTNAYIEQFNKLGSDHKYVEFHGGPADPSVILKDLNDGGGGTVFDRGMADYSRLPMEKSSSDLLAQNRARMGLEKTAGWFSGKSKERPAPAPHHPAAVALASKYQMDPGFVADMMQEDHGDALEHNVAFMSALQKHHGGPGVEWDAKRWGGPHPELGEKKASVDFNPAETAFERMFHTEDKPLPYAEPFQDIIEMREKLADNRQHLASELSALEVDYLDVGDRLYYLVKQAALEGTPLGHVVQAWSEVVPGPAFVKVAFGLIGPRLVEERVLNYDEMGSSLTKTAGAHAVVDMEHPLVSTFSHFCDTLLKLAATREVLSEVADAHEKAEYFLTRGLTKVAETGYVEEAAGLIPKAWRAAKGLSASLAAPASRAAEFLVGKLWSESAGRAAGRATEWAVQHAPHAAVGLAAKEIYDRARYTPAFQAAKNYVLSQFPYTQQNLVRQYDLQNQMMGFGP